MIFSESTAFSKAVQAILADDDYFALQDQLLEH